VGRRVGVLTVSDRSAHGEREDRSGPALASRLQASGWTVAAAQVVPDERLQIRTQSVQSLDNNRL